MGGSPGREQAVRRAPVEALRQTVSHLFGAERRLRGRDSAKTSSGGLTMMQARSLAALGREREMTAGQLARSADLNPATVTAMLDHLEAAGIVERHRSEVDRRVCNITVTEAGWQLLEERLRHWQSVWEESFSGFQDEELETANRVLVRVVELVDSIDTRGGA